MFVADLTYEAFENDELRLYAVTRCLEIVSEASRRLPEGLKTRYPAIKWRERPPPATSIATNMTTSPRAAYGSL